MPKTDPAKLWSLNYRLLMSVISSVAPGVAALGLETKELFVPQTCGVTVSCSRRTDARSCPAARRCSRMPLARGWVA